MHINSCPIQSCAIRHHSFLFPGSGSISSGLGLGWSKSQFFYKTQTPNYRVAVIKRKCSRSGVIRAGGSGSDYYSTLNVSPGASLQEIKASYKKLARKVRRFFQLAWSLFYNSHFSNITPSFGRNRIYRFFTYGNSNIVFFIIIEMLSGRCF